MTVLVADVPGVDVVGVIELHEEGAYLLVFDRSNMSCPRVDNLQDDVPMAKLAGRLDHGIPETAWVEDNKRAKIM